MSFCKTLEIPCEHRFSVTVLRDLGRGRNSEEKYFKHLTGFSSYEKFEGYSSLFSLEGITYWNTKAGKHQRVDTSLLFDSDQESSGSDDEGNSDRETDTADSSRDHVLSVESFN